MKITRLFAIGTAALLAAACGRSQPAPDDAATRDLQLAPAAPYDQFASPQELGYQPATGTAARPGPVYQTARPAATRTVQRSSGAVYRAPQKVTHTKRDAVIGAAAGAVTGAVIGRSVKGAVIGAAAGGVLGAVVGATVDVDHR